MSESAGTATTEYHRLRGSNNGSLSPHSFGTQQSKVKVPARLVSGEGHAPWRVHGHSAMSSHGLSSELTWERGLGSLFLFSQGRFQSCRVGPTPYEKPFNHVSPSRPQSLNAVILGLRASTNGWEGT